MNRKIFLGAAMLSCLSTAAAATARHSAEITVTVVIPPKFEARLNPQSLSLAPTKQVNLKAENGYTFCLHGQGATAYRLQARTDTVLKVSASVHQDQPVFTLSQAEGLPEDGLVETSYTQAQPVLDCAGQGRARILVERGGLPSDGPVSVMFAAE